MREYLSSGQLLKEYHFHPQKTWMTDPLFQRTSSGEVYYYHNDHLGTPQQMLDALGNTVWSAQYSAFGKAHVLVDTVENNLRFPGQYFDVETGLHQNYFRDYDSVFGRYAQGDPIGLQGGVNMYAYSLLNPIRFLDPLGLDVEVCRRPVNVSWMPKTLSRTIVIPTANIGQLTNIQFLPQSVQD